MAASLQSDLRPAPEFKTRPCPDVPVPSICTKNSV
eukprot:CAMPEP_0198138746 /NCGR_PEP_ID=MMETSP1443-20131203/2146_1 /TAXON_ID=186043 /ORGANISM="Entomoneis sp., Strain CCMP2396" /LENGTH=34 /DNA_ID= /DNA_START= /DNA_END= /DNA_ORIENTATION=